MNSFRFCLAWFLRPRIILLVATGLIMLAYSVFSVLQVAGAGTLSVSPGKRSPPLNNLSQSIASYLQAN